MASFASSYIPTTSATVTRAADVASMTGTNFSDWYNASEGTFVVEGDTARISAVAFSYFLSASNGTTAERLLIRSLNADHNFAAVDGGTAQADFFAVGAVSANTPFKSAFAYKVNDFAGVKDGGAVATDGAGTLPTPDRLFIGADATGGDGSRLSGHIRRLTYYPARLSNALLQTLTA